VQLGLTLTLALLSAAASVACKDSKKDPPASETAASAAPTPVAAPQAASAASAAPPAPEGELEEVPDSGVDGGTRKRRRLVGTDAGAGDTLAVATPPTTEPTPTPTSSGKRTPPAPMGNDQVYGASAASAAPVLKKKPLPDDDPWGNKH
jgi:hypothetical protein